MKTLAALIIFPLFALLAAPYPAVAQNDHDTVISEGEIRQLLAPIALYPDALLSQVLIASTYPLEVVEAERWSRSNPGLEGQAAVDAVAGMDWDPSIKALVAFPDLLARMSEELEWTRRLGEAFLLQEEDVIAAVQDLRERAESAGSLARLDHARAYRSGDVIVIEPADPRVVYVPYYSPRIVYGGWWWPGHAPYYWYPPSGYYTSVGFYWGGGVMLSSGFFFSSFDWPHRHIVILRPHRHHSHYGDSPKWKHDPKHRRGVVYREPALNRQFGRATASGAQTQAATGQQSAPRQALHRPGAYYSSGGDRRTATAGSDDRRTGAVTTPRSQGGGTAGGSTVSGNRPSGLRRSAGQSASSDTQETGSATGGSTDGSAASTVRPGFRSNGLQRSEPFRTTREASATTPRRESTRGTQTRSTATAGPQQRSSSFRGGETSRGGGWSMQPSGVSDGAARGRALR